MGLFFNDDRERRPWAPSGKKRRNKPKAAGATGSVPSWKDSQKQFTGALAARAMKERLAFEAQKDGQLSPVPEEMPVSLPGKRFAGMAVMSAIFVLSLLILVGLEIRHNQLGRVVSELTDRKVALIDENRRFVTEMERITVVGDLEQVARETLGLVSPAEGQIVIIH
ncbi:MAG: hypothetical protein LBJ61_07765 [Deltaproteobacteria bacterium]|nr:hypothetical protein [Deltaproteobacteria bacterium]